MRLGDRQYIKPCYLYLFYLFPVLCKKKVKERIVLREIHLRTTGMVPFESLDTVFYSPAIVIMAVSVAVCEIFSVNE